MARPTSARGNPPEALHDHPVCGDYLLSVQS
jgi:hypothetical protein